MQTKHTFKEFYIPSYMMGGINLYINKHTEPGSFLSAIISNDLMEAVGRADEENLRNIPAYVDYFYNKAPSSCWGSAEKFKLWLEGQ